MSLICVWIRPSVLQVTSFATRVFRKAKLARRAEALNARAAAIKVKIEKAVAKDTVESQLTVHQGSVGKAVLAEQGVKKLLKGRKKKRLKEFNAASYSKGQKDAKDIDLEQRAIKGEKRPR